MGLVNMTEMLKEAQKNHYAVGMFDVVNLEMTNAVVDAAVSKNAPVIVAIAEVHIPTERHLKEICNIVLRAAKDAPVPVALHLDHATRFENIRNALEFGFTSIMYDGSVLPYEENVKNTKYVVELAKKYGASVEAELGHVGGVEGGGPVHDDIVYTEPDMAEQFAKETQVDALAVSIGTAHGLYVKKPKLNIELLKQIRSQVATPLVLHGGSGLSDEDFRNCVEGGISKINIYSEIAKAGVDSLNNTITENPKAAYPAVMFDSQKKMQQEVERKIELFGGSGKAMERG